MKRYFGRRFSHDGRIDYSNGKPIWWAWNPDTLTSEWVFADGSFAEPSGLVLGNFSDTVIYKEVVLPGMADYAMDEGL